MGLFCLFAVGMICALNGCGSKPTRPRTTQDILEDRKQLPYLYLTEKTQSEVLAPLESGRVIVDPKTGEIAWQAFECNYPSCPGQGKGNNGRPFLFTWPDPSPKINEDGKTVSYETLWNREAETKEEYLARLGGDPRPTCPECKKAGLVAKALKESRMTVNGHEVVVITNDYVKLHVPHEYTEGNKALDDELAAMLKKIADRKAQPMNKKPDE